MDTKTSIPFVHSTVMGPNYSYVFDFEREFEHEETKEWFLVSFSLLTYRFFFIYTDAVLTKEKEEKLHDFCALLLCENHEYFMIPSVEKVKIVFLLFF